MAQNQQVSGVATSIRTAHGITRVQYHRTIVVKFDANEIILDTGGWRTVTTKLRMNQASNQFDLGYQVYQHDFNWFVVFKGRTRQFVDAFMVLTR